MRRAKPKVIKSLVRTALGPLEEQLMRLMCATGKATVRDVVLSLNHQFAYTTIMSTMDRLYHKGLLRRESDRKAFVYYPAMTGRQLEAQLARDLITAFLACGSKSTVMLAAALVDSLAAYDANLLDEVAAEIRARRWIAPSYAESRFAGRRDGTYDWPLGNA